MKSQTIIEFVKLMDRGMMVIPQKIRNSIGLKKGEYLKVVYTNRNIILTPMPQIYKSDVKKKSIIITPSSISKKKGLELLSKKREKPLWTKADDAFLKEGRDMIEKRLQKYDQI